MSGRLALGLATALLLSACGSPPALEGKTHELQTLSDQTSAQKRAQLRLQLAVGYYENKQYEIALDEIKQAILIDPASADAYGMRALIYMAMGENVLADENFQRALKLAPDNPNLSNNYGSFLCQAGRPAQAIPYFEAALRNRNYQAPLGALVNAGSCSLKLKNFDAAERYLLDALRLDADQPATNAALARLYLDKRDPARAAFFVNRMLAVAKLDTLGADALWAAIRVKRREGDKQTEASLVAQLSRRFPTSAEFAAFQRGAFNE
ncbi:type IV pilus biogenesis/stability protein PilW [Massilia sp. TS11]|uniref:type IV pilus biogenesis/stability protein PilW n=1 Tax=Massilia sp. TS11 TaxID=2908003 RepID=UPI001ED9F2B4|nr:type IV pilus biogenesis/stability protein PilW [Massilia sp. TS11]MCG2583135.1 type IV pilus biogenesis/stability protein PilW [Massilia sp. TS11]